MVTRIDNKGGSYSFHVEDRSSRFLEASEIQASEEALTFISAKKIENGVKGLALGDGLYFHEGTPPVSEIQAASKESTSGRNVMRTPESSRLEHEHSATVFNEQDSRIISATPRFDFISNKAELVVEYADKRQSVIKASNKDVLAWVQNHLIENLVQQ